MKLQFVGDVGLKQFDELGFEFLNAAIAQTHPKIREWCNETLEADLREAQNNALASLVDDDRAKKFSDAMHVLALPPECFKSRLIEIGGLRLIAAMNFRDVSGRTPYIRILQSTAAPGTIADWSLLKDCFRDTFRYFNPQAVFFFHPSHLPLNAPRSGVDQYLLAAPAKIMINSSYPTAFERVELRRSRGLDFYSRYREIYDELYRERPILFGEIRTETEESLLDCLADGMLFEIFIDGKWAGVVAADRRTVMGIRGVHMIEIVLAKKVRGQKLGAAVHLRFAQAIAKHDPSEIIVGTISSKNPWSRQTALHSGRLEIGAWRWVELFESAQTTTGLDVRL